jgi:hypothetical protein
MADTADARIPAGPGFVRHDYVLLFSVRDAERRARLESVCARDWEGDHVLDGAWEVSSTLGPDAFESALLDLLGEGDRAAFYYVSDSKRLFRVVLEG